MASSVNRAAEPSRERVVALVLALQRAFRENHPLTQEEIVRELRIDEYPTTAKSPKKVRAYDGNDTAVRQKFERDKARIRDLGFAIETVVRPDGLTGYQIDPSSVYAPPLHFTPEEYRVVATALGIYGFGTAGAFSAFSEAPASDGGLEFSAFLTPAIRAINLRRRLRFPFWLWFDLLLLLYWRCLSLLRRLRFLFWLWCDLLLSWCLHLQFRC